MAEMDRELGLRPGSDSPAVPESQYRDRLLLADELEETAEAIRARVPGFHDVGPREMRRVESALHAVRAGLGATSFG